jgi:LacI family transcriptional regulator
MAAKERIVDDRCERQGFVFEFALCTLRHERGITGKTKVRAMITIRELAKASGFSPTTISLVMNNSPAGQHIPAKTKESIRGWARKLGYYPNQFARSLRSSRSGSIAVIVPDVSDPYCAQVLLGVDKALYRSPYLPLLVDIQNSRARFRKYIGTLFERRIEGVIAVANSLQLQTEMLDIFANNRIPVAAIGRESSDARINSVSVDNRAGARLAITHLFELGHRKIAFIRGPKAVIDSAHRWLGIVEFAKEVSLPLDSALITQLKDTASSSEGGFEAMRRLLRAGKSFSAVMAFDDMTAFGAIQALTQAGLKVPEQCSVVGFDDIAAAAHFNPPLTTIGQSMEELGKIGVSIFLQAREEQHGRGSAIRSIRRMVEPVLAVRASTARV